MRESITTAGEIALALTALIAFTGIVWRFPPFVRVRGWIVKGHAADQRQILVEVITETIAPLDAKLDRCVIQLWPNGGGSMNDRLAHVSTTLTDHVAAFSAHIESDQREFAFLRSALEAQNSTAAQVKTDLDTEATKVKVALAAHDATQGDNP